MLAAYRGGKYWTAYVGFQAARPSEYGECELKSRYSHELGTEDMVAK